MKKWIVLAVLLQGCQTYTPVHVMKPVFTPFPVLAQRSLPAHSLTVDESGGVITIERLENQRVKVFTTLNDPLLQNEYPVWR